jgi:hypothetical protein
MKETANRQEARTGTLMTPKDIGSTDTPYPILDTAQQ